MCASAFTGLGHAQARELGFGHLPIAVVPYPFATHTRAEIRQIAEGCSDDIARLLCESGILDRTSGEPGSAPRSTLVEVPADLDELNRFFQERRWSDGLMVAPPTAERVARMLRDSPRAPGEVVARVAPAYAVATVENIAINAVLAGCYPEYLPVLIAAVEAVAAPEFHLQNVQATTNPAAVWLILNGPIARTLGVNSGNNCLGQGTWANAALGRALRLVLQNLGGARPGDMDRATHGQPGKYTFCCAENEAASPWEPLHVERGFAPDCSTVTVVGALGTWNTHINAGDAADFLRVMADVMAFPGSSDYTYGGAPWIVFSPEHARFLKQHGLKKAEVKQRLWEQSKLAARRLAARDFLRTRDGRRDELGDISPDTLLPITIRPEEINILVAGGAGTHSLYVPVSGHSKPVTREVMLPT